MELEKMQPISDMKIKHMERKGKIPADPIIFGHQPNFGTYFNGLSFYNSFYNIVILGLFTLDLHPFLYSLILHFIVWIPRL